MINERIRKILESESLTASAFADIIQVQRSGVSHLLSGRNKPSLDVIQKILRAFPRVSPSWLIMGEGSVYKTEHSAPPAKQEVPSSNVTPVTKQTSSAGNEALANPAEKEDQNVEKDLFSSPPLAEESPASVKNEKVSPTPTVTESDNRNARLEPENVVVLYPDGTFKIYKPE